MHLLTRREQLYKEVNMCGTRTLQTVSKILYLEVLSKSPLSFPLETTDSLSALLFITVQREFG